MIDEIELDFDDFECWMDGVVFFLKLEFVGLWIGCVLVSLLDLIFVDVYGS